jgi:hypothetical protein
VLNGLTIGTIVYLSKDDDSLLPFFDTDEKLDKLYCFYFDQLELYNVANNDTKGDTNMSVSPQEIKNLKLSEGDRLLREAGFVDEAGNLTGFGDQVVRDKAFEAYKDEIVNDLRTINKAKKAVK